jgi:hypothetical protein
MKLWVGVTDKSWFEQLAARAPDGDAAGPRSSNPGPPVRRTRAP